MAADQIKHASQNYWGGPPHAKALTTVFSTLYLCRCLLILMKILISLLYFFSEQIKLVNFVFVFPN